MVSLLKSNRLFAFLCSLFMLSSLSSRMFSFAFPLLWIQATKSPLQAGMIATSEGIFTLVGGLVAGVVTDRYNRIHLMQFWQLITIVVDSVVVLLVFLSSFHLWPFVVLAALSAVTGSFAPSAESALVRSVVSQDEMAKAMSLRQTLSYSSILLGPVLAGLVLQLSSHWLALGIPIVMGLAVNLSLILFRLFWEQKISAVSFVPSALKKAGDGTEQSRTARGEIRFMLEGFIQVTRTTLYRDINIFLFIISLGSSIIYPLLTYGLTHQQTPPVVISFLSASAGIGGILGSLFMGGWVASRPWKYGRLNIGIQIFFALVCVTEALFPHWQVFVVCMFLGALISPVLSVGIMSLFSAAVPPELQGRVFSASAIILTVSATFAPGVAGLLLDHLGIPQGILIATAVTLCGLPFFIARPLLRRIPATGQYGEYLAEIMPAQHAEHS